MFFISKRKFEEKVHEKVCEAMENRDKYERFERINENLYKLDQRVAVLENKHTKGERWREEEVLCGRGGN